MSRFDVLQKRKLFRKGDLWLLAVLALLILGGFWFFSTKPAGGRAVVRQDGAVLTTVDLSAVQAPYTIDTQGDYPATLLIEPDGVSFQTASCPDKLCVRTGKISQVGQTAVCLPARLSVTIEGGKRAVDGITG